MSLGFITFGKGLHIDNHSCDGLRSFLLQQAATMDEERAAQGSLRNIDDEQVSQEHDHGVLIEDAIGQRIWLEASQFDVSMERGGMGNEKNNGNAGNGNESGKRQPMGKRIWLG